MAIFNRRKQMTPDKTQLTKDHVLALLTSIREAALEVIEAKSPKATETVSITSDEAAPTQTPKKKDGTKTKAPEMTLAEALKANIDRTLGLQEGESIFDGGDVSQDIAAKVLKTFNQDNNPIKFRWRTKNIVWLFNWAWIKTFGGITGRARQLRREIFSQVDLLQQQQGLQSLESMTWESKEFTTFGIQTDDGQNTEELSKELRTLWQDKKNQAQALLSSTQFDHSLQTSNQDVAKTIIVGKNKSKVDFDITALGDADKWTIDNSSENGGTLTMTVKCQRAYGLKPIQDGQKRLYHLTQDGKLALCTDENTPKDAQGLYTLTTTHQVTFTKDGQAIHMQSNLQKVAFENHYTALPLAKQISESDSLAQAIQKQAEIQGLTTGASSTEKKHSKEPDETHEVTSDDAIYLKSITNIESTTTTQADAHQNAHKDPHADGSANKDKPLEDQPDTPSQPTQTDNTNTPDTGDSSRPPALSKGAQVWKAANAALTSQTKAEDTTDTPVEDPDASQQGQDAAAAAWESAIPAAQELAKGQGEKDKPDASNTQTENASPETEIQHEEAQKTGSIKKKKKKKKNQHGSKKTRIAKITEPVDPKSQFGRLQQQFAKGTEGLRAQSWEDLVDKISTMVYNLKKKEYILTENDASLAQKVKDFIEDMKNAEPVSIMSDELIQETKSTEILGLKNPENAGHSRIHIQEFPDTRVLKDPYLVIDQKGNIACHTPCSFRYYLMEITSTGEQYYTVDQDGAVQSSEHAPQPEDGSGPIFTLEVIAQTQFQNQHSQGFDATAIQTLANDHLNSHAEKDPFYKPGPKGTSPAQAVVNTGIRRQLTETRNQLDVFCDQVAEKAREAIKDALIKKTTKGRVAEQMSQHLRSESQLIQEQAQQADLLPTLQANITQRTGVNLFHEEDPVQTNKIRQYLKGAMLVKYEEARQQAKKEEQDDAPDPMAKFMDADSLGTYLVRHLISKSQPNKKIKEDPHGTRPIAQRALKSASKNGLSFEDPGNIIRAKLSETVLSVLKQDAPPSSKTQKASSQVIAKEVSLPTQHTDTGQKKTQTPGNNLNQS